MATKVVTPQTVKTAATKKGAAKKTAKRPPAPAQPARPTAQKAEPLTHRLDALLHTMRCIAQHEDQLCTLLHDARKTGRVSAALRRDLSSILAELPAEEYTEDLHAVLELTSTS